MIRSTSFERQKLKTVCMFWAFVFDYRSKLSWFDRVRRRVTLSYTLLQGTVQVGCRRGRLQIMEWQHQGKDRPVTGVAAAHNRRHKLMGSHRIRGLCWTTPTVWTLGRHCNLVCYCCKIYMLLYCCKSWLSCYTDWLMFSLTHLSHASLEAISLSHESGRSVNYVRIYV